MKEPLAYQEKLDRLVEQVIARPEEERTAFLRAHCGDDPDLYDVIVSLLDMHEQAARMFGDSALAYAAPVLHAKDIVRESHPNPDERIGPYRLLEEIGRGGMGTVYLAERTDGVHDQPIALKLVNVGLAPEFVARFRAERKILASLNHPGIARLLDGGETQDGRPYLVMEYVAGEPLTTYADRNRLTVDQRLDLFGEVCDAVAFAHRNLVVHRDLKPSNVLVSDDDGGGRSVKLLDFGIAKLLDDDSASVLTTTVGHRMMTPDYAAPEQIHGEPVTTSTDVYALGVLLYRLLTGHRPYRITHRTRQAVESAILSADPVGPSLAVAQTDTWTSADGTTTSVTPKEVSIARSSDVTRLSRQLKGDLDTIVLKSLRKEPERRYGTAEALGRDIIRHRTGLPVEARPDRIGYRIGKFVKRHQIGVVATLLVFAALLLGLGLTLWQSQERVQEAARADRARDFVLSIFELADPDQSGGEQITTEDLLDHGAERAIDELGEEPEVQEQILLALGAINNRLYRSDEARTLFEFVLEQRTARLGRDDPGVAEALTGLASAAKDADDWGRADSLLTVAITVLRRHDDPLALATALYGQGIVARRQGDLEASEARLREALALRRRHVGPESPEVVETLNSLAFTLDERDVSVEAELIYREALTLQVALSGEFHPSVAELCHNLGALLREQGRYTEADSLYRRALAVYRQVYPGDNQVLIYPLGQAGSVLIDMGRPEAAQAPIEEGLAMARRLFADDHSTKAMTTNNLALALGEQGRYTEAIALQRDAVSMYERIVGPNHRWTALVIKNLAEFYLENGDVDIAEAHFRRIRAIQEEVLEPGHSEHIIALVGLGRVALAQGRAEEAERLFRDALTLREEHSGPDHQHTAEVQSWLGASLTAQGRLDEARPFIEASARFGEGEARRSIQRTIRNNRAAYRAARGR